MRQLVDELDQRAAVAGMETALVDADGEYSLSALLADGNRFANVLDKACGSGATVLIQADNSWRTAAAMIAVGRIGGVLAVISRHATAEEFSAACADIVPDAMFAAPATADRWTSESSWDISALAGWIGKAESVTRPGRWATGAAIGLTSGSTGRAKGIVHSEDALRYAVSSTIDAVGLQPGEPVAGMVPLSSMAAVCFGLYLPLFLGGPAVLADSWDPATAVPWLDHHQVRWTMCVPTMALQLATAAQPGALAAMRAMTVGGGPMDAGALERAEKHLGTRILRVFGMSECLGHTTPAPDDDVAVRLGRDGRPFPGTEIRAVNSDGKVLPAENVGQAEVRGPSLFLGYARGGAVVPPELSSDGFFRTGDLTEVHQDGTISIKGREKNIIIRGGRNIDVAEVESAVASHPHIDQVCVVPLLDNILGERIAALAVTDEQALDLTAVTTHLAEHGLSKNKWPEFFFQVSALPQNRVGKLSRPEATKLAQELHEAQ